jgi:predicted nucleotidyltransferase
VSGSDTAAEAEQREQQALYDQEMRKLVEILKQASPHRVIRFGSSAGGKLHDESDIDLCVLLEAKEGLPRFRRAQQLYRLLTANDYAWVVDVEFHVYSPQEYVERLKRGDPFVREIAQGEVVYAG